MILAGGVGSRMKSPELPKQYIKLENDTITVKAIVETS